MVAGGASCELTGLGLPGGHASDALLTAEASNLSVAVGKTSSSLLKANLLWVADRWISEIWARNWQGWMQGMLCMLAWDAEPVANCKLGLAWLPTSHVCSGTLGMLPSRFGSRGMLP